MWVYVQLNSKVNSRDEDCLSLIYFILTLSLIDVKFGFFPVLCHLLLTLLRLLILRWHLSWNYTNDVPLRHLSNSVTTTIDWKWICLRNTQKLISKNEVNNCFNVMIFRNIKKHQATSYIKSLLNTREFLTVMVLCFLSLVTKSKQRWFKGGSVKR